MSDAAPPPWAKRAPGLAAAHKFLLMVLWGYGPFKRTGPEEHDGDRQPGRPVVVWASRQTLAEATDQPVSTVKKQLSRLASDGWIMRVTNGSKTVLAWREPHTFDYGWTAGGPEWTASGPVHERAGGVHERAGGVHERAAEWTTSGPQSSIDLPIDLPTELEDDAHGREELTHGDTPPTDRQGAMGAEHPAQGLGGSGPSGPRPASPDDGAGQAGAQAARRPGRPGRCADPPALPAHVEASLARATGAARGPADHRGDSGRAPGVEPRGGAVQHANARLAPDHDLTSEIWAVVIAGGWAHEAEHPMFRQALLETVRDKGLEAADLAQIFARYQLSSPMLRPDRSRLFYTRGRMGKKARDFLDRALGRDARPQSSTAYPMDGGLHVVGGAS